MKKFYATIALLALWAAACPPAHAEVAIETEVSRSRLAVGEELQLDIIVTNADGKITRPALTQFSGFTSYSQGHSQEISIINGRSSQRSIFSFVLIANSPGKKVIGPFELVIGGKPYKVGSVEIEVTPSSGAQAPSAPYGYSTAPAVAPPARALPNPGLDKDDIFVKVWLDKEEVYVNEPAVLTYTLYTRLSATYKGFEIEPVTTGFWVEDFPPDKTIKRTEQIMNGSRYVVADVRKMALFPTETGVISVDPGVLSAEVELRDQNDFDSFFSYNVFGRRSAFPTVPSQVVQKKIPTEKKSIVVKALPDAGKPKSFAGAVGGFTIQSSVDKMQVEAGTPFTYKVRIGGQGNIHTVSPPAIPPIEGVKVYESASSTNVSKDRLLVEGEKIVETVMVPKKEGTVTIPALEFTTFNPRTETYRTLKTSEHVIKVLPGTGSPIVDEDDSPVAGPSEKSDLAAASKELRYLKTSPSGRSALRLLSRTSWRAGCVFFILGAFALLIFGRRRREALLDERGMRLKRSRAMATRKLQGAGKLLKEEKKEEFYAEVQRALSGFFADKMNARGQSVSVESVEAAVVAPDDKSRQAVEDLRALYEELAHARFARADRTLDEMKKIYDMAGRVITRFDKVRLS